MQSKLPVQCQGEDKIVVLEFGSRTVRNFFPMGTLSLFTVSLFCHGEIFVSAFLIAEKNFNV